MTAENFDEILRAFYNRTPFEIFTVELVDGQRFEIDFPRALSYRNGVAVFLSPGGVPVFFDHESVKQIFAARANTSI